MSKYTYNRNAYQLPDGNYAIPLTRNAITIISPEDTDLDEYLWCIHPYSKTHYALRNGKQKRGTKHEMIRMHRVILERMLGRKLLDSEYPDHIDGNGLNNTRANLRVSTVGENMRNKSRYDSNKEKIKGVYKRGDKYRAQIQVDRKKIMLGTFSTPEEAYRAYCDAAVKYHGEFARFE